MGSEDLSSSCVVFFCHWKYPLTFSRYIIATMFLNGVQSNYRYQNKVLIPSGENRHHSKEDWKPVKRIKEKNHDKASLIGGMCTRGGYCREQYL